MALNSGIHWGCILRVNVDQAIKQEGWKWLLQNSNSHNFDREIFGGHSTDMKSFREWGFRGSEAGLEADFVETYSPESGHYGLLVASKANWLEYVDVKPLVEGIKPFGAFMLKDSAVNNVISFDRGILTKGFDVEWTPPVDGVY